MLKWEYGFLELDYTEPEYISTLNDKIFWRMRTDIGLMRGVSNDKKEKIFKQVVFKALGEKGWELVVDTVAYHTRYIDDGPCVQFEEIIFKRPID